MIFWEKNEFYDTFSVLRNTKKEKKNLWHILCFKKYEKGKKEYLEPKIGKSATIAYNMNMCLRFFTFTFLILPNLAKYMYR